MCESPHFPVKESEVGKVAPSSVMALCWQRKLHCGLKYIETNLKIIFTEFFEGAQSGHQSL